jgi:ribosomal protein S18 acetylase RimI-like enzyme
MSSNLVHATGLDSAGMARLIEENLSAKSHDFAKLAGGKLQSGNPTWFVSGLNRAGYNGITFANLDPNELNFEIERCLEPFLQTKTPLTWWVGPLSSPAALGRALQQYGFVHNRDMIGMAASLNELTACQPLEAGYSFEPVMDVAGLVAWMPLFARTFGIPETEIPLLLEVFAQLSFAPGSAWRHYFLRADGQIVATGSLHLGAGVAGLYNIATQPEYRQRGLGREITLLIFEQARQMGYELGTLQTTYPNALRLYHRIGFEVYCKIGIYQRTWPVA